MKGAHMHTALVCTHAHTYTHTNAGKQHRLSRKLTVLNPGQSFELHYSFQSLQRPVKERGLFTP